MGTLNFDFRPAIIEDQPVVYDLIRTNLPSIIGMPLPDWTWDEFLKSWRSGTKIIVSVANDLAGYLRWEQDPDRLHLADLQIVASFRRQGLATQALAYFEQQAAALSYRKVSLIVHDANTSAQALYAKLGYRCERRDSSRSLLIKVIA